METRCSLPQDSELPEEARAPRRAGLLVSHVQWPSREQSNRYPVQESRSLGEPMGPIYKEAVVGSSLLVSLLKMGIGTSTTGKW